jgi:hypothetical protein
MVAARRFILLIALGGIAMPLFVPSELPTYARLLAVILWTLCLLPAWQYLRMAPAKRRPIPFLPFVGMLYGFYCALPMLLGAQNIHWKIVLTDPADYVPPLELTLAGWTLLLASHWVASALWQNKLRIGTPELTPRRAKVLGVILLVVGVIADLLFYSYNTRMPKALVQPLRFLAVLNWAGVGLLTISWKRGWLGRSPKLLLCLGIVASVLIQLGSGSASNLVWVLVMLMFAIWLASRTLQTRWLVVASCALALIVVSKGVTDRFRQVAWWSSHSLSATERTQLMLRLLQEQLEQDGLRGSLTTGFQALIQRSAMMDMFADVIRRTPDEIPYWNGESYISLPAIFVPRVLWPDKPEKNLGQRFGHRYGYSGTTDDATSVNFAYLVEFYANFGSLGVLLGMTLVGVLFAGLELLVNRPRQPVQVSVCGLVLLQPLFNIESDFSLTFGGVFTTGIALACVALFMRRLRAPNASKLFQQGSRAEAPIHPRRV